MSFELATYKEPDFMQVSLVHAPDIQTETVKKQGVAPENFHAMTIFPEYFKINGRWILAEESRMDCVTIIKKGGVIEIKEFRRLEAGDQVVLGRSENGQEGIYVHINGGK